MRDFAVRANVRSLWSRGGVRGRERGERGRRKIGGWLFVLRWVVRFFFRERGFLEVGLRFVWFFVRSSVVWWWWLGVE